MKSRWDLVGAPRFWGSKVIFFQFVVILHNRKSLRHRRRMISLTTGCRDCLPLITNEESSLGSLKFVFINFWKLAKYKYFRAKRCGIQQPYTDKSGYLSLFVWGSLIFQFNFNSILFVFISHIIQKITIYNDNKVYKHVKYERCGCHQKRIACNWWHPQGYNNIIK